MSLEKVRATASRATHPETKVVECSLATGCQADYGHMDLLLGRNVETEVFPHIRDWLAKAVVRSARAAS